MDFADSLTVGLVGLVIILVFLFLSALFSSSENAYFSLSPKHLVELNKENSSASRLALDLINEPDRKIGTRRLLATILLMNNLINIFIVVYSSYLFDRLFNFPGLDLGLFAISGTVTNFLIQVVLITFLLVLLGEIIPKIYATQNNLRIVKLMSKPLSICYKVGKPLVLLLAASSSLFDRYLKKRLHSISMEEISQAIDIADENKQIEEKDILKGIINFGNTSVNQIMQPRTSVRGIEIELTSDELMAEIKTCNFSRIPVFEESFDNVKGILYVKDLLPHLHDKKSFKWQDLIKPPLFVPEVKKIDDLLEEFQEKRVHMAIVVDEYGGTNGIVTMEDILEEVFGEIKDEFDQDDLKYSQLDDKRFVFEASISLKDAIRILEIPNDYFSDLEDEPDTLGGLIMEVEQDIPKKGDEIQYKDLTFVIEAADNRRIKRIKLTMGDELMEQNNE